MTSIVDALEVTAAQAHEQEIVRRLIQLYQHDFSEFARIDEDWGDVDDKGLFSFISLKATGRMSGANRSCSASMAS